jgi:hypothetical protein
MMTACKATAKTKYDATVAKLTTCPPCLDKNAVRDSAVSQINTTANTALYYDGTVAFGGGRRWLCPARQNRCEVRGHRGQGGREADRRVRQVPPKQADTSFKSGTPADDDACEQAAITKFGKATVKLTNPPCPACLVNILSGVGPLAELMIDGMNCDTYCASPSGAFPR